MKKITLFLLFTTGIIMTACNWIGPKVEEHQAEFPGGIPELRKFLANNIRYPDVALEMGIDGKCFARFVVSRTGEISNVHIVKGVPDCPECDAEVARVIKQMPNWKPAISNGRPVNSFYNLPVTFRAQ